MYGENSAVFRAIKKVKRQNFVPPEMRQYAQQDRPLPIGYGQTISAIHMYAIMLESGKLKTGMKVLEVGTGSGYGAALLKEIVGKKGKVYSIELIPQLSEFAKNNLKKAGYDAKIIAGKKAGKSEGEDGDFVSVIVGDGHSGYPPASPYDRIFVTAAAREIPSKLISQLKKEGLMLIPVGGYPQTLYLIKKLANGKLEKQDLGSVLFVPLIKKE
ncbi:MAG: protein-L-isoaspartate(D-aspartate) O-methyltransferase [Candidatus Micrarchaeota archaeon]